MQIRLNTLSVSRRGELNLSILTDAGETQGEVRLRKHEAQMLVQALNVFIERTDIMGDFPEGIDFKLQELR